MLNDTFKMESKIIRKKCLSWSSERRGHVELSSNIHFKVSRIYTLFNVPFSLSFRSHFIKFYCTFSEKRGRKTECKMRNTMYVFNTAAAVKDFATRQLRFNKQKIYIILPTRLCRGTQSLQCGLLVYGNSAINTVLLSSIRLSHSFSCFFKQLRNYF